MAARSSGVAHPGNDPVMKAANVTRARKRMQNSGRTEAEFEWMTTRDLAFTA
jgi:hypothetical protein